MRLFEKVKKFVDESFKYDKAQLLHFERTVYWLKHFRPDADEEFLIAAYAHDIERAFRKKEHEHEHTGSKLTDADFLEHHQEEGARIISEFLLKNEMDEKEIENVKHLVSKHEKGGDEDQNLLKDVDSLSFVENNAEIFLKRVAKLGYERIKEKFDWMHNRISSPEIKEKARPFYEMMIAELKELREK